MVVFNDPNPRREKPLYRVIHRRITFPRPDSPIYTVDDSVEDIYPWFNVPEDSREEEGEETIEEMVSLEFHWEID